MCVHILQMQSRKRSLPTLSFCGGSAGDEVYPAQYFSSEGKTEVDHVTMVNIWVELEISEPCISKTTCFRA